jgi:GT2 family glycosyltransferase
MKANHQVTAIIPTLSNFNGLKKVIKYLLLHNIGVVVIDNQPSLEKRNLCENDLIKYLPQQKNLGFAIAVNKGFEYVNTSWTLILNDDIEFADDSSIVNLVKYAKNHDLTAVSPVLKRANGEIENYGYQVLRQGRVNLNFNKDNQNLDGITAACLLIKTTVFKKIGGFDESFFAYLEDVDLFIRMKKKKFKFGIDYQTWVIHNHQTTSKKMGNFKQKMDLINWWRLFIKHYRDRVFTFSPQFLLERLRNLSGFIKATLKYVVKNKK